MLWQLQMMRLCIFFLGLWLIVSSIFSNELHHSMIVSDVLSGVLLMLFSWTRRAWSVAAVGLWLQLAPLLFWATSSLTYTTDTIVGALAILCSVILPGFQWRSEKSEIPPGMTHNPSLWRYRLPVFVLALLAHLSARYMASFQLGYISSIWDPVFGNGTHTVITSDISKMFPVSDAGLGAVAYLLEALLALKGSTTRWKTAPWIVAAFGVLVVPVGIVSTLLILSQPLVVGAWCFWCLLTAFFMVLMILFTWNEVKATYRILRK